ncbi:putative murein hydrolase (TIGR00659 family) [Bacillus fengqiuensis]|nr:putative murein hydrolase (TIGR00659 family) [Bacillus fengqiuensis]
MTTSLLSFGAIIFTLLSYLLSKKMYRCKKMMIFSPIVFAPILLILLLSIGDIQYETYKKGANFLSYMLGPATVAFAIPMYKNFQLLKKHSTEILVSVIGGTTIATLSSLFLALLFHLNGQLVNSLIPRSITIPIAVDVSKSIGGDPSVTVLFVIVSGILGTMIGPKLIHLLTLRSAVAKGLLLGVAAHGTGTARAFEIGKLEGTFSSLAMIIAAIITLVFAHTFIPALFNMLS